MLAVLVLAVLPFGSDCHRSSEPQLEILASIVTGAMEIVGGTPSHDPPVVALLNGDSNFCTGTLIAPGVVVTAAHCFDHRPGNVRVYFGSDTRPGLRDGFAIGATEIAVHPSYDGRMHDIALVRLATDPGIRPKPIIGAGTTAGLEGHLMRIVGFGINGAGTGVKLEGLARVSRVTATELMHRPEPSATCNGDSGGPGFVFEGGREVLAAVHIRGSCGGESDKTRIDVYMDSFIRPFLRGQPIARPTPQPTSSPVGSWFDEVPGDPVEPLPIDPLPAATPHPLGPYVTDEVPGDPVEDPGDIYVRALEHLVRREYAEACPHLRRYLEIEPRGRFASVARSNLTVANCP